MADSATAPAAAPEMQPTRRLERAPKPSVAPAVQLPSALPSWERRSPLWEAAEAATAAAAASCPPAPDATAAPVGVPAGLNASADTLTFDLSDDSHILASLEAGKPSEAPHAEGPRAGLELPQAAGGTSTQPLMEVAAAEQPVPEATQAAEDAAPITASSAGLAKALEALFLHMAGPGAPPLALAASAPVPLSNLRLILQQAATGSPCSVPKGPQACWASAATLLRAAGGDLMPATFCAAWLGGGSTASAMPAEEVEELSQALRAAQARSARRVWSTTLRCLAALVNARLAEPAAVAAATAALLVSGAEARGPDALLQQRVSRFVAGLLRLRPGGENDISESSTSTSLSTASAASSAPAAVQASKASSGLGEPAAQLHGERAARQLLPPDVLSQPQPQHSLTPGQLAQHSSAPTPTPAPAPREARGQQGSRPVSFAASRALRRFTDGDSSDDRSSNSDVQVGIVADEFDY